MLEGRPLSIVLVELDALLDTRLPTLGKISSTSAVACANDNRYFERVQDDFSEICGIGKEAFRQVYAHRDAETVENAIITEIPFVLNELVCKLEMESIDTPFLSGVGVEVNIWPYTFEPETQDAIALAVMARCGRETEVICVRKSPAELTPSYIRSRYSGLILYNFRDWMAVQLENFKTVKMPAVSVLAPALYYETVPDKNAFAEDGLSPHITAFQLAEVGCVELFALSLLPAANFSMARLPGQYTPKPVPETPREAYTPPEAPGKT